MDPLPDELTKHLTLLRPPPTQAGEPSNRWRDCALFAERYLLTGLLGAGGFGYVCSGVDLQTGRRVAVKLLIPDSAKKGSMAVERFEREIRLLEALKGGEGIPRIEGHGTADGYEYMVLEYIWGFSLDAIVLNKVTSPSEGAIVEIAMQALAVLNKLHKSGSLHRDIHPNNLMLDARGKTSYPAYLLDLGLGTVRGETGALTAQGNPHIRAQWYCSPEGHNGLTKMDQRSDIWSLGATLYSVSSRERPPIKPLAEALPLRAESASPALQEVIARATAHAPDDRFQDVDEFLRALDSTELAKRTELTEYVEAWRGSNPREEDLEPQELKEVQALIEELRTKTDSGEEGGVEPPAASEAPTAPIGEDRTTEEGPQRKWLQVLIALSLTLLVGALLVFLLRADAAWGDVPSKQREGLRLPFDGPLERFWSLFDTQLVETDDHMYPRSLIHERTGIEFVFVPSGVFRYGAPEPDPGKSEVREQRAEVQGFYLAKLEVTEDAWRRGGGELMRSKGGRFPAQRITFGEIWNWCLDNRLSLPTEFEWEWAASGVENREYPWGMDWAEGVCNALAEQDGAEQDQEARLQEVDDFGEAGASWCGIEGMAGGVWEWCLDLRVEPEESFPSMEAVQRRLKLDTPKFGRGGAWSMPPEYCTTSARARMGPGDRTESFGFRPTLRFD